MIAGLWKNYEEYLNSSLWKEKRDYFISCIEECQICGKKKGLLIHHINYNSVGNESMQDILVVCHNCHKKIHEGKDD